MAFRCPGCMGLSNAWPSLGLGMSQRQQKQGLHQTFYRPQDGPSGSTRLRHSLCQDLPLGLSDLRVNHSPEYWVLGREQDPQSQPQGTSNSVLQQALSWVPAHHRITLACLRGACSLRGVCDSHNMKLTA